MSKEIVVALTGNPNSGKTTVFNNLTGSRQHVGNWPGVTVEKKEGSYAYQGYKVRVIDLPGVYSLTAYSPDEVVARNFILEARPDVVVNVVDASNLERNLYLTVQLLELEARLVVALNMMDVAQARDYQIDVTNLARELGAPVVPMVANHREGHEALLGTIRAVFEGKTELDKVNLYYGGELEEHLKELEGVITQNETLSQRFPARWMAIKLLEGDTEVLTGLGINLPAEDETADDELNVTV
jgi:ferrous iron transport protein B